jgi:hypothetical protein
MERLTFNGNFCDISQCRELPCPHGGSCTQREVWEKLKAYEDTGLTPKLAQETAEFAIWVHENGLEKIKEWIKADKAGRLVVLPCKVGTATYYIHYPIAFYPDESEPEIKRGIFTLIDLDRFGHSVFLTREEAEKALEAMKDGN